MDYIVLVVDDDNDDFILLEACLKKSHDSIFLHYVESGDQAIEKLQSGLQPHLILADAHMPRMNGHEFLGWLMHSDAWQHIPIIIWTGAIAESEVVRYYTGGANSVMLKQDALNDIDGFCRHWFKLVQLPQKPINKSPAL